jgi:hypothetical protein
MNKATGALNSFTVECCESIEVHGYLQQRAATQSLALSLSIVHSYRLDRRANKNVNRVIEIRQFKVKLAARAINSAVSQWQTIKSRMSEAQIVSVQFAIWR